MTRVMVIDDEPTALLTTQAQLMPEGYELVLERSGADALRRFEEAPVDLVICDVNMPEIDGLAVCRALKAHPEWSYVPIILLTAFDARDAIVAGLEAGADTYVSKPVEGAALRARARAMLRVRRTYQGLRAIEKPPPPERRSTLIEQAHLTTREREVLDLLLLGRTHEDIGTLLGISERTSKFHQANLLNKLGAESRLDLLRLFL
jgi:DNA-binding NarL/FixJ family response regulator